MDNSTLDAEATPLRTAPAAPGLIAPGLVAPSLADEVRATLLLFGTVLLVILGFGLASTFALRLLAS
ncbi:MAG: hypothetical protein QOC60_1498 [Frankiaceae bacterium]|jgi:hypothetical protein|nr:hypothetical protein [Frankiaceae bacterium]MDQ1715553.1 hypothetical protein [Frankiaceae bacterium]